VSSPAAAAREPDEPDGSGVDVAFRALAVPHRRRILRLVRDGEMSSGEIARHFAVTPQAVSQHLRTLRDAGLLAERREGVRRLYVVRPEALAPVREAYVAEIAIEVPPHVVFQYFVEPAKLMRWMGEKAELDPRPGGVFAVDIQGLLVRGQYTTVEPPRRLVFTWGSPDNPALPAGSTSVEVTLEAREGRRAAPKMITFLHLLPRHAEMPAACRDNKWP
jgi:uncharacterized protein YndB with AHSA1/START domain